MQVPTTVDGLKRVLKDLGYPTVLDGADLSNPAAKDNSVAQLKWEFENATTAPGNKDALEKAISLLERFPWPTQEQPMTNKTESAVETLPAPKNAPPPKIMKIVEFDKPAQEIVIERVKPKVDDLMAKGLIPQMDVAVAKKDGIVEVLAGQTASQVRDYLNLPVVLAEALQGRGLMPKGMERYHAYYEAVRQKIQEAVSASVGVDSEVRLSPVAEKAVETELVGAYLSVLGSERPLFSRADFVRDPVGAVAEYKKVLKRAGYTEMDMDPKPRRTRR